MTGGIVVLTGAGISAESGLRTFRADHGLWEDHHIEDVATPEGFARDPALVHRFYNDRRRRLAETEPNAAHIALAEFEAQYDGDFFLVTQNIDDLHERGGSRWVTHMHGELLKVRCQLCALTTTHNDDLSAQLACLNCGKYGGLRPDIVWFGEMPYQMERIYDKLATCKLFVSIGTSGNVYPAAGFVRAARSANAHCIELNMEESATSTLFHDAVYGKATDIVPKFFIS